MGKLYLGSKEIGPTYEYKTHKVDKPVGIEFATTDDGKVTNAVKGFSLNGVKTIKAGALHRICYNGSGSWDAGRLNKKFIRYGFINSQDLRKISGDSACASAFARNSSIVKTGLDYLEEISGNNACQGMFEECDGITSIDMNNLKTISGDSACYGMFTDINCKNATDIMLPSLVSISGNSACSYMFSNSHETRSGPLTGYQEYEFPSLQVISGNYALSRIFYTAWRDPDEEDVTWVIRFSALSEIEGNACFSYMFDAESSYLFPVTFYFPALTTQSFKNGVDQFKSLCSGAMGTTTVHFPSNLEPTIQGLTGYPTFGGRTGGVNLLYDLPVTS